jgi:hypothetical protein
MVFRHLLLILALVEVSAVLGCSRTNSLNGAVTYNGEPVGKGSIAFQPADGKGPAFGAEVIGGKYTVEQVLPGKYIASIRGVHEKLAPQSTEEMIRQYEEAKAAGKSTLDHFGQPADYIPDNAEGNGQTVDIDSGANTLDFALKGPPRAG